MTSHSFYIRVKPLLNYRFSYSNAIYLIFILFIRLSINFYETGWVKCCVCYGMVRYVVEQVYKPSFYPQHIYTNTNRNSNPNNIILWNLLYSVIEIRESKSNRYLFRHSTAQHSSINNLSLYCSIANTKEECLFRYSKTRIVENSNDNQSVLASDITSLDHPKAQTDVYEMNGDVHMSERNGLEHIQIELVNKRC